MNANVLVTLIMALAAGFFKQSPALQEVEVVLPQLASAFDAAKNGTAFSVNHSLAVDGKAGTFSASWTPN